MEGRADQARESLRGIRRCPWRPGQMLRPPPSALFLGANPMRRMLLLLVCLGWCSAAESVPVPAPLADPAPASSESSVVAPPDATAAPANRVVAPPPADAAADPDGTAPVAIAAPHFDQVVIANEVVRVTLTTQRGGIVSFELLDEHPVVLSPTLRHRLGNEGKADPGAPLALLEDFRSDPSGHKNLHDLLDFANSAAPNLDQTADLPWNIAEQGPDHVTFALDLPERGLRLQLAYRLKGQEPRVVVKWTIGNSSSEPITVSPRVYPINGIHQDYGPRETYYLRGASYAGEAMTAYGLPKLGAPGTRMGGAELEYAAVRSRFFAAWWQPIAVEEAAGVLQGDAAPKRDLDGMSGNVATPSTPVAHTSTGVEAVTLAVFQKLYVQPFLRVDYAAITLAPGANHELSWQITGAGMTKAGLARLTDAEQKVQYTDGFYRFFKSLSNILAFLLDKIALVVMNYGVALIILTCLIKLALHRTTFKQQSSMMKMSKLAPEIKVLQERYKGDRQQLGVKTMELYKKNGVNPLGGCLPMLIQLPMFMALYQMFTHSADFRGSSFLWIKDLTLEDAIWGVDHPMFHWLTINPLALIYIGVTLWMSFQHKVAPGADPQQAQMQKMMRYLPLIFGIFFYHMPTGLVLYFTVNAILSTIEIKMVKRKLGMP